MLSSLFDSFKKNQSMVKMTKVSAVLTFIAGSAFLASCGTSSDPKTDQTSETKFLIGWTTINVNPGQVGYVYKLPRAFKRALPFNNSEAKFVGAYKGPYQKTYLDTDYYRTVMIDVQWQTYSEAFQILAADDLNVKFKAHMRLRPKSDEASIRSLVENYRGRAWYDRNVKEPVRTYVRDAVQKYPATDIKANRETIEVTIKEKLDEYFADKPFEIDTISVGNIDYPDVVEKAVERKLAREQELEENSIKVKIAEEKKKIRMIDASAEAEAQRLLRENINDDIIKLRWIEAQMEAAKSDNKVIYYVPVGPDGMPIIHASTTNGDAKK